MISQTTGTLSGDVVKLDESVAFADNSRVRVRLEPLENDAARSAAAFESFRKRAEQRAFDSGGIRFTRDA